MPFGKLLIVAGTALLIAGAVVMLAGKLGIPLGRLPGDIHADGKGWSFSFPILTCLILSLVLTLVSWLLRR